MEKRHEAEVFGHAKQKVKYMILEGRTCLSESIMMTLGGAW